MNDFTKEELKELLDCIHWKINEGQEEKLTKIVDKKIQSMIDNYSKYTFKAPDDMDSSAISWKYKNE